MKKNFKMFALSILSLVSISLCSGLSNQVKTNAEEVTPWEVRYDFEDKVFGVESAEEAIKLINERLDLYDKHHEGIELL